MNENETPAVKLKLDKLDLPIKVTPQDPVHSRGNGEVGVTREKTSSKIGQKKSQKYMMILSICLAIFVFILISIFFVWKSGVFQSGKKTYDPWEIYATIGPIHATVGAAGDVRMTVSINCGNPETQEIVKNNSSEIKARLLLSLGMPGVEEMIIKRDYEALKAFFRDEINSMLDGHSIREVYLSDFLVY